MKEFREFDGELKLLERQGDFIFPVELWMLNDSVNRNNWQFVNLEQHREAWAGVPILVAYVNGGKTVGSGHNQAERLDPMTGETYQSFTDATAERIVGAISENPADIRLVERDGYTWVVGKGFLWAWYARELVNKITQDAQQGRTMSVSIEALVTKERIEDGVAVEEEYRPLGVTVLGDKVDPAVVDAHIAMLSSMEEEFKELKLRAASYMEKPIDAEIKPKNNSEKKGMNRNMKLSKQQLRELQAKFQAKFEGYKVLAAEQRDNGIVVCLMSSNGITAVYQMASLDETVCPEKMHEVNAQVHFCAEDGEDVCVDASDMTECAAENKAELEKCQNELAECKSELETMKKNEEARRLSAAKKMAEITLEEFNRDRAEKVDVKALEALNADIEAGKFTALCDENGAWMGETAVQEKVLSVCAKADMEYQKKIASQKASVSEMTWGDVKKASAAPGTVGELLAQGNH